MSDDLIERLRAPQWYPDKPTLLEAADALAALQQRVEELQQSEWALQAKVSSLSAHETCGCSWDTPDDLCLHHSPKLAALQQRVEELETLLRIKEENTQKRIVRPCTFPHCNCEETCPGVSMGVWLPDVGEVR